jgi:regulator of protease activity HflC (stomatin/prohibitin superfamily)
VDAALGWIGRIADSIFVLFPTWIVLNTTEGGVKFVTLRIRDLVRFKWETSVKVEVLGPGLHVYWPAATEVKSWVVARQSVNLPAQTVTTKDGKVIAVGGLLIFRIGDAETLIAHVWNPDQTIRDIAQGVVHEVCSQSDWGELQDAKNDGRLSHELRRTMRKRLRAFGVKVLGATLTDFAPCRVLKVIQSTSQDAS